MIATRPRGPCPRCDRPLTPERWDDGWHPTEGDGCLGDALCAGPSVDWRARALAAEARLAEMEGTAETVAWKPDGRTGWFAYTSNGCELQAWKSDGGIAWEVGASEGEVLTYGVSASLDAAKAAAIAAARGAK